MTRSMRIGAAALLWVLRGCMPCGAQAQEAAGSRSGPVIGSAAVPRLQNPFASLSDIPPERIAFTNDTAASATRWFGRLVSDQRTIWTSPAKLRFSDMNWLAPVAGLTAGLFATDAEFNKHFSPGVAGRQRYNTLSDAGLGGLIAGAGGLWIMGQASRNQHWTETGLLAGEAALNSFAVVETLKYSLRRERPLQANSAGTVGAGAFFQGRGDSFPSAHAALAWSVAGVIAHEYPGPLTKIGAFGLATLISYSRLRAHQHFPSDVLVGSLLGTLISQQIYSRHHDRELGGGEWQSIGGVFRGDGNSSPANHGSPYVPLDSWTYPLFDRLAGLGMIDSGFASMRPWTRGECARLVNEAGERIVDENRGGEASKIYDLLEGEFRNEIEGAARSNVFRAQVESVYARVTGISGAPQSDGYHFGQTVINDYGRPYESGLNAVDGFSAWTSAGPWVGYVRAEYQHAPSAPAVSLTARQTIATVDALPVSPATPFAATNRVQLLDAYVGMQVKNWAITFGRQSLWWGPGEGGPVMFSTNSTPIDMFRVNHVAPLELPRLLSWLGPMRLEFFLGQLTGHEFLLNPNGLIGQYSQSLSPQPFIHGERVSFKPTRNFEFGVSRTTIYGGPGYPLTTHTLLRSLFSAGNENPGGAAKPGDRRSGVDFSYRLPKLRTWLTFYGDGFADDQFSPIGYFDRSAWHAGLSLSHFPGLPKLDLRIEGMFTDVPPGGALSHGFFYANATWRDGYTNGGALIGSWIGRESQGAQAWTNYWFRSKNRLQLGFRHQKVSQQFLPGGGTLTDVSLRADVWISREAALSSNLQYETWSFPVIRSGQQGDLSASLQLTFWLKRWQLHGTYQ